MTGEIVKVQVPIIGDTDRVLIYDQHRRHQTQQPLTTYLRKKLNGNLKGYFRGHYSSIVGWAVNERVEDQSW